MNIRAHYDLPEDIVVDVEIHSLKDHEGHMVSILVRNGKDALTNYILNPTYFPELDNPKIYVDTFEPYGNTAISIKSLYEVHETTVYVFINVRKGTAYLVVKNDAYKIDL